MSHPLRDTLAHFGWSYEPARWHFSPDGEVLEFRTQPDTDYWQRTHYGFQRDNGHFLAKQVRGDFSMSATFSFEPNAQYDQCGLMCRLDSETWIKCSLEYETPTFGHLGSVVTDHGYSDWATQEAIGVIRSMHYRIERRGCDYHISWSLDGGAWHQMRICHLDGCPDEIAVGVYACSPVGQGFTCRVHDFQLLGQEVPVA